LGFLGGDDRLDEENRAKVRTVFAGLKDENAAYTGKTRCVAESSVDTGTLVDHVRLFRNRPDVRWKYRVHEQILPALRSCNAEIRATDIIIDHVGYLNAGVRSKKFERDMRLLLLDHAENPEEPFTLFNLGWLNEQSGKYEQALGYLQKSLANSSPTDSIVRKLYSLIVECHRRLGRSEEAVVKCIEGLHVCPEDASLLFQQARVHEERSELPQAEGCLVRLINGRDHVQFGSSSEGLRAVVGRHHLACLYRKQNRLAEAEAQWREAIRSDQRYLPAWLGLGETMLSQGKLGDVERVLSSTEPISNGDVRARSVCAILKGRWMLARQERSSARQFLEPALQADPNNPGLLEIMSHALLQEGRDWDEAERVLRRLTELEPGNREAQSNLQVLLRQQGKDSTPKPATLAELYEQACRTHSDVNEHVPTLCELAKECEHVTEFGTRTGVSTAGLLMAQPKKLVCYDMKRFPQVDLLGKLAGPTEFIFHQADVRTVVIEETDMLFIDTWHIYEQLREELRLHADKVRKYIVLHDTTTFGENGETEGHRGLWPAVEELLAEGRFRLRARYENNNGLTVLERTA
jgi:tetratricopeptide (TPR) repeat protein